MEISSFNWAYSDLCWEQELQRDIDLRVQELLNKYHRNNKYKLLEQLDNLLLIFPHNKEATFAR